MSGSAMQVPSKRLPRYVIGVAIVCCVVVRGSLWLKSEMKRVNHAAHRAQTQSYLKNIVTAMHNYVAAKGGLPPRAVFDREGKPLLSWRVLLLPYVGYNEVYEEFKLDESWDSPHNRKLIERMPKCYAPAGQTGMPPNTTFFQVISGPGTPFERPGLKFEDLNGGARNTFLIVEAGNPVIWTKPEDLEYQPDGPLPALGGIMRDGQFHIAMADGSVTSMGVADEDAIRAGITGQQP